ncbi:MAG: response regulator [Anaerolineae bacterium]|nr:response regulator [Anaerolineae bacterium]
MPDQEELIADLHSALAHLDDPPYLENHPLVNRLSFVATAPELSRGQALRRALRLAIAALDPGASTTGGAIEARCYQVLYRWAVAREGMVAVAASLGISRRQAYRDLRQATEALAQVLGSTAIGSVPERPLAGARRLGPEVQIRDELERLSRITDRDVDLARLVADAVESAGHLARERGLEIRLEADAADLHVAANRVMLRQAVLNLLSHAISVQREGAIDVQFARAGRSATIQVTYRPQASPSTPERNSPYEIADQILRSLGIPWASSTTEDGAACIRIQVPLSQERTVLIVEDNEGVILLFRRYLQDHPYRVFGASSGDQALKLMDQLQPDVVILDVMMPEQDGWEVLQMLRSRPSSARARFVVCSIINDPGLASALGADAFLNKPVDRASLLQVLAAALGASA